MGRPSQDQVTLGQFPGKYIFEILAGLRRSPTASHKATEHSIRVWSQADRVTSSAYCRSDTRVPCEPALNGDSVPQCTMKTIHEEAKKSRTERATLFNPIQGGDRSANPTPNLYGQSGGSIKRLYGIRHATMNSKSPQDLPQQRAMNIVVCSFEVEKITILRGV